MTMLGLKNIRVLITGGASEIGAATAERFLKEEARVLVLDRDEIACKKIEHQLPELSGVILADVSNPEEVDASYNQLDHIWGGLEVLINNAGISIRHSFLDITVLEWQQVLAVNLLVCFMWLNRQLAAC